MCAPLRKTPLDPHHPRRPELSAPSTALRPRSGAGAAPHARPRRCAFLEPLPADHTLTFASPPPLMYSPPHFLASQRSPRQPSPRRSRPILQSKASPPNARSHRPVCSAVTDLSRLSGFKTSISQWSRPGNSTCTRRKASAVASFSAARSPVRPAAVAVDDGRGGFGAVG